MAIQDDLLPPHSGAAEKALAAGVVREFDFAILIKNIWNVDRAPADVLPWLGWALSVDEWDPAWSEENKRATIRGSVTVHRLKGTIGSIRRALINAGYGDAEIIERFGDRAYDGTLLHDGSENYSSSDHWAEYRVKMARPITIEQAQRVRNILVDTAPARCRLKQLDFQTATFLYNAELRYDGSASHGAA